MAGKGAPEKNTYAKKDEPGKTISLYLNADDMALLRQVLGEHKQDTSDNECVKLAKKAAKTGINRLLIDYTGDTKRLHFTYYLDGYEEEFLMQSLKYRGEGQTQKNLISLARKAAKEGISQEMRKVFALYEREQEARRTKAMYYKYALNSSMTDRVRLNEKATDDGYEDAKIAYSLENVLSGDELQAHAKLEAEGYLINLKDQLDEDEENETAPTDDEEEFVARYTEAYAKRYEQTIDDLREEEEEDGE